MGIVALSVLVFEATDSPFATAGLFLGNRIPAGPPGAPARGPRRASRHPGSSCRCIYCGEAVAFAALGPARPHFSLAAVIVLATIDGTLALAGRALTRAVVAALLEPTGELRAGNAVLNVAFTTGAAIGPGIAGLVVAGLGVQTALILDAASFYPIALILFTAGPLPRAEPEAGEHRRTGPGRGLPTSASSPSCVACSSPRERPSSSSPAVLPIEVIYAKKTLGAGDAGLRPAARRAGASGMVVGGIVFAALRKAPLVLPAPLRPWRRPRIPRPGGGARRSPLACVASAVGGAGNGVQWVSAISAVQELTESGCRRGSWRCSNRSGRRCQGSATCSAL